MERKRMIQGPDGVVHDAVELGCRPTGEHWNEYLLDDGTVARLKLVVTNAYRIDALRDPKGQPVYIVESTNVTVISAPEDEGS